MNLKQIDKLLSKSSTMPIEERKILVDRIQQSIEEFKKQWSSEQRYKILAPLAEEACGNKLNNSRERDVVLIRMFIAYKMRLEGYSLSEIGRVIHRHHATVLHYAQTMVDMNDVPKMYAEDLSKYKSFESAINEYDKNNPVI